MGVLTQLIPTTHLPQSHLPFHTPWQAYTMDLVVQSLSTPRHTRSARVRWTAPTPPTPSQRELVYGACIGTTQVGGWFPVPFDSPFKQSSLHSVHDLIPVILSQVWLPTLLILRTLVLGVFCLHCSDVCDTYQYDSSTYTESEYCDHTGTPPYPPCFVYVLCLFCCQNMIMMGQELPRIRLVRVCNIPMNLRVLSHTV